MLPSLTTTARARKGHCLQRLHTSRSSKMPRALKTAVARLESAEERFVEIERFTKLLRKLLDAAAEDVRIAAEKLRRQTGQRRTAR
ncbi:MAG: hypothetical protein ABJC89_26950 [Acidobacteriota bacterium]